MFVVIITKWIKQIQGIRVLDNSFIETKRNSYRNVNARLSGDLISIQCVILRKSTTYCDYYLLI